MVDLAYLARSGNLTSIASEARSLMQRYDIREVIRKTQPLTEYLNQQEAIRKTQPLTEYLNQQEAIRKTQPLTKYFNQQEAIRQPQLLQRYDIQEAIRRSLIHRYGIQEAIRQPQLLQHYDIREVIRQSQSFQPYWIDWSYIPSHKKIKFLIRLNKVSNNITPSLTIDDIVLLWFQDFEDRKKRLKKAEKLINLILNGLLTAVFCSRELHLEPFNKQVETIIAIDDFERCARDGFISKSAPKFASYWRAKLKTQLGLPVQAEKKTYENSKARTLLLACLDNYNGTPPSYKTLLTHALSNVPQGYEGLKLIDHEKFAMKKLTWNGGSIYLKQFSKAFANEKKPI